LGASTRLSREILAYLLFSTGESQKAKHRIVMPLFWLVFPKGFCFLEKT